MLEDHVIIGGRYYQDHPHAAGYAFAGVGWPRRIWTERAVRQFSRQLAMLLESDVALPTALSLVRLQQKNVRWQKMLLEVERQLQQGSSLADTLACLPYFRKGYIQTLLWAESKGDPNDLILALRLLAGDTDYRPAKPNRDPEEVNLDMFARRLSG